MKIISTLKVLFMTFVLYPYVAVAGTASQTDWSGGDGIWGPVTDWGNEFYLNTDIDYCGNPSGLTLQHVILRNTVSGSFAGASSVYSEDINGDGYMDILGAAAFDDDITWWENQDGSGTSWTEYVVDGDFDYAFSVHSADINGDGYMDILGAGYYNDDITWWENIDGSGSSWTENTVNGSFAKASSVYSADINGDGYMDILGASFDNDDIIWWKNVDGSGTNWIENIVDWGFYGANSVYSADINGDGHMDVLGAAYYAGCITWWENKDGSGTSWTENTIDMDYYGARSVYSADINGDGYMDVLGAGFVDDDITWWENVDGSGTSWTEHTVDEYFDGARSVYSADMNGDGYMDILGAALYADDISWWENIDGSGTSWTEHTVDDNFNGARSVYSEDINGDGCMDVLGAAVIGDDITWWDLAAYLSDGSLESSVLDVQESPYWQTIDWTCSEPAFTNLSFQVRASDNSSNMGAWSDILTSPGSLNGILTDGDSLFQYRVILATTNSHSTPVLDNVTVTWNLTGIEGGSGNENFILFGAVPNPSINGTTLVFSLPVDSSVELIVYDLTGRMVTSVYGDYESGVHEVIFDNLASGMYMVRMTSEEFAAVQRFVVIK